MLSTKKREASVRLATRPDLLAAEGKTVISKKVPNPTDKFVGSKVRLRRNMLGLNQTKLAVPLGVTYQQVQKYETGTSRIGAGRLQQIAEVLQVPISYFFEGAPSVSDNRSTAKNVSGLPDYAKQFINTREGQAIAKAFSEIGNGDLKDCLANLIKCVASEAEK
jgi:transcriptional regulator with XRE-family HTH domain